MHKLYKFIFGMNKYTLGFISSCIGILALCALPAVSLASNGNGSFSDNFDSYTIGTKVDNTSTNPTTIWNGSFFDNIYVTNSNCFSGNCITGSNSQQIATWTGSTTGSKSGSISFKFNNTSGGSSYFLLGYGNGANGYLSGTSIAQIYISGTTFSAGTSTNYTVISTTTASNIYHTVTVNWSIVQSGGYSCSSSISLDGSLPVTISGDGSWCSNSSASDLTSGGVNTFVFAVGIGTYSQTYLDDLDASGLNSSCTPGVDPNCNSNVMFLPGLEGSNLFTPDFVNDQVWVPTLTGPSTATTLDLTNPTYSNNIYARDGQIIGTAFQYPYFYPSGFNVYSSFINQMNAIATGTTPLINAWEPIAYDWRLDYQTLLANGNKTSDGKIYYRGTNAATSTPYIIQELKKLAASSRTGKVTIVAHSNGGLLAKALLMQPGISQYVDKVIMVATPQLGASKAIAGILNGYETGLPHPANSLFNNADGRYIGQNMPSAYNLLPSSEYFANTLNPVVTFDSSTLAWMATKYGSAITSSSGLRAFMTDTSRPTPARGDLNTAIVASSSLFDIAASEHTSLDAWAPPAGVQLITIAGWGVKTPVTVNYYKEIQSNGTYATTTGVVGDIDGDGTVIDSSAQWSTNSTSTKYWVDFSTYNKTATTSITHANILTSTSTLNLLSTLITNGSTSTLPQYVSATRPTFFNDPRIELVLHSPLTLGFTDSSGNYTGSTATTTVFNSPGVEYQRFGEVQWLSVPASTTGQIVMKGTGSGSFALDVQSVNGNTYLATTTFAAVPCATATVAIINLSPSISPTASSTLLVDEDGNGTTDLTLQASQGNIVLPPAAPVLTLVSTSTASYIVHYANMPANTVLAFANVSHQVMPGYRTPITAGGSGTTTILAYNLAGGYTSLMALASTSTSTIAETPQFYVTATVSSQLTYVSADITGQTVTVHYSTMPTNTELVFVNNTSGAEAYHTLVSAGGSATSTLSTASITSYGSYYLKARDATTHTTPNYAQTVNFYISDPNGDDGM